MVKAIGVIPARLDSTRLPRKVLLEICGKPLIQYVYESAKRASALADVYVACDHELIQQTVESFGGKAWLTRVGHKSGTERISEIVPRLSCDVIVNIQGDEPLIDPSGINDLVEEFSRHETLRVATLAVQKEDLDEYRNPNVVKVVRDQRGFALYFSRSPIPCSKQGEIKSFLKHLGVYAYRREFLLGWGQLKPSRLEETEQLEQLRILDNGFPMKVILAQKDSVGVDSEADFKKVERILKEKLEGVRT